MSISFAATPQAKEGQQTRAYTDDVSAGAPPSRRTGYDRPYVNRDHWNKVFTQPEYFDSIAKQKGMVEGAKVSLHGDDYVYRQAMMGYLSATRNVPLDDMRSVFDAEKDGFAQKVLGKKTATSRELFDWHKTKFERENEKEDAARTVIEDVTRNSLQDAMMGGDTPFVQSVAKSIEATGDLFTEEEKSRLWEKAEEQDKKIRATQAAVAPEARFLFSALGQITGQQAGMGAPDMREVAGKFAQLPDNQRKAIYELAGSFAQLQKTDKGFWYQLAESLGRGTTAFTERIPRNFREQTLRGQLRLLESEQPVFRATGVAGAEFSAAGSTPATPEEREQAKAKIQSDLGILKVEREIRDLAERVVDPIKTVTFLPEIVEEGLYGAAQSIPYTVAAAIPYVGMPAVASALFSANYDSIMLQYDGIDPDKAALIAAASAPIEAVLERLKVNTITGRLPVFGGLVKRLQHPNQRNITRIAIGGVGIVAEQNVQEIVQNATFPLVQTIAAALDQDMPDYDWAKQMENYPRELAVQFVALLPLSLMGMGALSHREMTRGADYIRNKSNLERMGYGEDQIDRITGAATADEAQTILQDEHGKRDPEAVKAAAKRVLDEVLALREQKAPASLPRLEKQGADYVVLSPEGKELARSTDQTVAEQALVSARRETVQREMRDVHTGINEAVEFIQKVNEARQRGEDIAEVIREQSPRTLLTDYEANPTQENLDRLFETVRAFGQEINEPAELANFPVTGSNQGALAEGIWRSVIRINEGADGTIVMREFAQDNLKRAISEGRTTMDFVRQQLNDVLPQIDSNRIKRQLRTETDTDVIEAFSDVALAYFRGSIREEQIPAGLRGIMRRLAIISRDIFRRAYNLARLRAEGKLDRDFEALLAEAVGVNQQALVDRARERTEQEVGAGQNYSISLVGQYVKAKRAIEDSPLAEQDGSVKRGAIGYVDDYDSTDNLLYVDFGNGAIAVDPNEVTVSANPNYSIAITPQQDTDYLAAVERGDMEMAQRMVDEAARAAGYTHQGLFHGSSARFDRFMLEFRGSAAGGISANDAFFLSDSERTARGYAVYAAEDGPVKRLMKDAEDAEKRGDWDEQERLMAQAEDMVYGEDGATATAERRKNAVVYSLFARGNFLEVDAEGKSAEEFGSLTAMIEQARRKKLDGVIFRNLDDAPYLNDPATHFAIFGPANIKSADPVTYDASGNVIPLSQRFDSTTADINYSIGLRPDVISQVSDRDDGSRVGTAKLGTDKVPVDTPQTSNISGDTVPQDLLAKQMAKVDYAHLPDSIRNESDPKKKRRKLINWFKKNLLALHDAFPEEVRARATHWYDGANRIAREFGQRFNATVEQASGVIAVFSPQKDWFMNVAQAMQFMELWTTSQDVVLSEETVRAEVEDIIEAATAPQRQKRKKAPDETKEQAAERKAYNQQLDQKAKDERRTTLDKIIGKTVRELDDQPYLQGWAIRVLAQVTFGRNYRNISPEGEMLGMATNDDGALAKNGWGSINEIEKAVRIMKDGALANISNNLGNEHKVRNFYNNIVAPNSGFGDATIDTHAVAAAHLMPYGAKATEVQHNFGSGMNSSDAMGVSGLYHVYLDAYREAAKERGLQPRQLQSITWEAIRLVYPAANKNAATLAKAAQTWNSLSDGRARNSLVGGTIPNPVWAGIGNVAESQSLAGSTEGDGQGSDAGRGLRAGDRSNGRQGVDNYSIGSTGVTFAEQLKELQAGESTPVDTDQTFWLIASSSGDIVDILDNEQDATIYFQTTASTSEWLWEYKDGLRTKVPLLKRGVAERRADGYIDTVRQEQENAGRVFYDGADTSAETTTSAGEIPSYTPDGQPWAGQEESVVYHGGRLFDPQGTDQGGYGETQTLKPRRPYQTYLYSISTQSEIDRVQKAMGALDRSPLSRLKVYEKMQERFLRVMSDNRETLAAMEGDLSQVRRTQILQALGELDGIISALPAEIRAKIGGYTQLAKVDPMDVFKGDQKVSEVRGMSGAIISAWMREGLNIGQAQKKTELPAGYRADRNLDPTRADRAIADVFIQRINRINEALEKFLRDEYNDAAVELFKRAKPQRSGAGEKPKGKLGATVHELFDTLKEATEWSAEKAQAWADGQWARIESGELNPYEQAHATLAAQVVPLFADWANADSTQRAAAVSMGKDILDRAYKGEQQRIIAQRTKRGYDRTDLSKDAGVSAEDDKARQNAVKRENSLPAKWEAAMLNLLNFDQVLRYVFGNDSKIAQKISDRQRKADNVKSDDIAALSDDWASLLTRLGGGEMQGQQLLFDLSRMDEEIDGVSYSQNQLVAITMMWMQPKGRQHMEGFMDSDGQPAGKWHYNQAFVNKAEKLLRPESKVIREYLLLKYDQEYEAINKVYRKVYGLNLPKNQFYSPLIVESINAPAQAGIDPVTGGVFAAGANSPSALRSRGGAVAQPVFRDAVQTYFGHMLQMAHWKAYAEFNGEVSALLGHRDTRNVVKGKAGEQAATVMNNWMQYFQQGGNKDAANHLAINQMINRVTGNFAAIALFGRVSTLALQVTQLGAASAKMPVGAYLSRFGKLMSGRLKWTTALDSDYIQRRIKDMPPAVALAMQGLRAEKPSQIRNAARWLGQHLSGFDGFFTAGTYAIVYDYQLSQARQNGMGGQEAADYAREATERIVDEIAQPTRAGARSIYELNLTNPVARAVWAFSSESRKNMGLLMYSGAKGGGRNFGKALTYVLLLNGLVGIVIRNAFRDMRDDDDDEVFDEKNWGWKRLAAQFISDPIYGIPVIGETIEGGIYTAFGVYQPTGSVFDVARGVPAVKRMLTQYPMEVLEGEAEFRDIVADVNRVLAAAGLFNSTIAGAASISNLAKDVFEVTDNALGDDE